MNVPGEDVDSTVRFEIASDGKGGSRFTLIQSNISDEMVEMGKHGWGSNSCQAGEADKRRAESGLVGSYASHRSWSPSQSQRFGRRPRSEHLWPRRPARVALA